MVASMATITSGILSPNSYVLNADAVALKLAHPEPMMETFHHRNPFTTTTQHSTSSYLAESHHHHHTNNSSDSDTELLPYNDSVNAQSPSSSSLKNPPKRNKRKNFKPRCSQMIPNNSSDELGALNLTDYHHHNRHHHHHNDNNNISDDNNQHHHHVRRRKPLTGPRKVVQEDHHQLTPSNNFTPMDLSGATKDFSSAEDRRLSHDDSEPLSHDSEVKNDSDNNNSDSDDFNTENYRTHSENEEEEEEEENDKEDDFEEDSKIPSSFSIHNLSKPHVVVSDHHHHHQGIPQNLSPDQIAEMRNYAMNTMRELLGIYGLTSEVAESISRQLPLAAFTTGKIFENLSLTPSGPNNKHPSTSLSEPPTPPSTPLSPKQHNHHHHHQHLGQSKLPHHQNNNSSSTNRGNSQIFPLNLNLKRDNNYGFFTNGDAPDGMPEYKNDSDKSEDGRTTTGIYSGNLSFSHLNRTDTTSSPPPMESPLNAMIQQSLSSSLQPRNSLNSSSLLMGKTSQMDYSKYVKKFSSSIECGSAYCKDLNYREHFHCLDCNSRVFIKKEEMIRHFKWHKKRDESLQHGFMRYSPLDDCGEKFTNCTHNKKQTHYHCIQDNCDKVYISTSDVQMHSNYHRKDSAIMQEGFQRYRATEECGASYCAFFGQRTTHFHCRRSGCRFTFKNKSDMEKHKTYHIKDEQLSRDGFKKFMKNEACPFENCRFSKVCNHIHCIRPQCSYVLHSSGQLFSHKRKHERKDSELAYRKYKLAQSMMKTLAEGGAGGGGGVPSSPGSQNNPMVPFNPRDYESQIDLVNFYNNQHNSLSTMSNISHTESLSDDRNSPLSYNDESEGTLAMDLSASETSNNFPGHDDTLNSEEFWRKYCQFIPESKHPQQQQCNFKENCDFGPQEHFHCFQENCDTTLGSKDSAKEHSRNHEQQEIITDNIFSISELNEPCEEQSCIYQNKIKHYHCTLDGCREVILASEKPFRRLEHYKMHQYSQKLSLTKDPLTATHLTTSIDGMFCRKRGRPPKNRVIEVWNDYNPSGGPQSLMDSPQAIFTSFKLPKPSTSTPLKDVVEAVVNNNDADDADDDDDDDDDERFSNDYANILQNFDSFAQNTKCPDTMCPYLGGGHFHCNKKRCLFATDQIEQLMSHAKEFHENVEILEGFEFYDRMVDCRLQGCASNKINRHFHCTRPNCNYSFIQYSQMALHNQKHEISSSTSGNTTTTTTTTSFPSIRVKSEDFLVDNKNGEELNKSSPKSEISEAVNLSHPINNVENNKVSVVRASGTFYPISTLPPICSVDQRTDSISDNHVMIADYQPLSANFDPQNAPSTTLYGPEMSCSRPFCKLKRKPHYHCTACNQAFSEMDKLLIHVARHNNTFPNSNNNHHSSMEIAASNNSITENFKHCIKQEKLENTDSLSVEKRNCDIQPIRQTGNPEKQETTTLNPASSSEASPYFSTPTFDAYNHFAQFPPNFATQIALMQQQNAFLPQSLYQQGIPSQIMFQHAQLMQSPLLGPPNHAFPTENLTSPLAAMAANLNKRSLSPHEQSNEAKKARIQNSMRILKDEPVPSGYLRFRFNEDCKYQHCGYREHQTHFHCQRQDCGYSFCDKTRFVQHTARHERLDTLMGGDFQQYRANVACGRQDCAYTANLGSTQNKASHFHCLKCEFVCTDTNKVVAHRRQHQKLDSIQAAGFEKFTPSQMCRVQNCQHSGKQTHYHCLSCQYAVLGLAQMSAHKYRHMEG